MLPPDPGRAYRGAHHARCDRVGAGNAALCAALAARERGAEVTVLEKAERGERAANTFFTGGGFRFPYDGIERSTR